MKIYTKTGDNGETSLYGGTHIAKDALRVWCYGTIDELNSALGIVAAHLSNKEQIQQIQRKLFVLGAELASITPPKETINDQDISDLEELIDQNPIEFKGFTVPGETSLLNAYFHLARTTARKAERYIVSLSKEESVSSQVLQYINRLSDVLYILGEKEQE